MDSNQCCVLTGTKLGANILIINIFRVYLWARFFFSDSHLTFDGKTNLPQITIPDQLPICHLTSFANLFITNSQCMPISQTTVNWHFFWLPTPYLWLFCIFFNQIKLDIVCCFFFVFTMEYSKFNYCVQIYVYIVGLA